MLENRADCGQTLHRVCETLHHGLLGAEIRTRGPAFLGVLNEALYGILVTFICVKKWILYSAKPYDP
jgi:hypothetical protein